jgi:hypothetical protein
MKQERAAAIAEELRKAGASGATLAADCYDNEACHQVDDIEQNATSFSTWKALNDAMQEATPYFDGYRYALETTVHIEKTQNPPWPLRDRIMAALSLDQTIAIDISGFKYPERRLPPMSAPALAFFDLLLNRQFRQQCRSGGELIQSAIAVDGWPKRSQIEDAAEDAAWLIVQHADYDPLLQYKALQLIGARVKEGEANAKNSAYLYDRIMLKIAGKQRYGTQVECREGKLQPKPLEDAERVDTLRAEVNLPSMDKYLSLFGPPHCPP